MVGVPRRQTVQSFKRETGGIRQHQPYRGDPGPRIPLADDELCSMGVPTVAFLACGKVSGVFEVALLAINLIANLVVNGATDFRVGQNHFVAVIE